MLVYSYPKNCQKLKVSCHDFLNLAYRFLRENNLTESNQTKTVAEEIAVQVNDSQAAFVFADKHLIPVISVALQNIPNIKVTTHNQIKNPPRSEYLLPLSIDIDSCRREHNLPN